MQKDIEMWYDVQFVPHVLRTLTWYFTDAQCEPDAAFMEGARREQQWVRDRNDQERFKEVGQKQAEGESNVVTPCSRNLPTLVA